MSPMHKRPFGQESAECIDTSPKRARPSNWTNRTLTESDRSILLQAASILGTPLSTLPSVLPDVLSQFNHNIPSSSQTRVPGLSQGGSVPIFRPNSGRIMPWTQSGFDFPRISGDPSGEWDGIEAPDNCLQPFATIPDSNLINVPNAGYADDYVQRAPGITSWEAEAIGFLGNSFPIEGDPTLPEVGGWPSLTQVGSLGSVQDIQPEAFNSDDSGYADGPLGDTDPQTNAVEAESSSGPAASGKDQTPKRTSTEDASPSPRPRKRGRRGPFRDPREREQTSRTRKIGACIRCRQQKIRCTQDPSEPAGPCVGCKDVVETALVRPICTRKKVTDAKLFDKGTHPQFRWSKRWKIMKLDEIRDWASTEVKTIHVTQDVSDLTYKLRVREFVPVPGDSLQRVWYTNGTKMSYTCPNYAIENMAEAGNNLIKFVDSSIEASVNHYIDSSDWLLHQTYQMALKCSSAPERDEEERRLLRLVLKLWVSVRMESRSERICGAETLGMRPQDYDPECHNYNQVLIPPVMSAQIELIAFLSVLEPMRKAVVGPLGRMMERNMNRSWFCIYLCLFVLLHSCALLTEFQHSQARKYGLESRYVYEKFVRELHHGSDILLSYFHYCNKGSRPLRMDWGTSPDAHLAELSSEETEFLRRSSEYIKEKAVHFRRIREENRFEDPYFFLAQLYDPEWDPVKTI